MIKREEIYFLVASFLLDIYSIYEQLFDSCCAHNPTFNETLVSTMILGGLEFTSALLKCSLTD